jgi:colanic acid biosynthesis glycosyl transferase WcaI
MRILYLSQYFPPEVGATQTRAYEMARYLAKQGHRVTMLTEVPNHPSGIIPPEYRGKLVEFQPLDGFDVVRLWVMASPRKDFTHRMAFYLSYSAMATAIAPFLRGRYDVIYATSPPLFVGLAALAISHLRRIPLLFEVRDIWPESAVLLGELHNKRAIALSERLERACYARARRIVVVTEGIRHRLLERGLPADKLTLIQNGANVAQFRPEPAAAARLRHELGLNGKFVLIYAGVHGLAQGMETLVQVADLLRGDDDMRLLFVGEGPKKEQTAALVRQRGLANVMMLGERPREQMPAYLSMADATLVPLKRVALFEGALPSKMFEALACATPVILSVGGEAAEVLARIGGGLSVTPEDAPAIVAVARWMKAHAVEARAMGERGRAAVIAEYSREAEAGQLEALLRQVVGR